MIKTWPNEFQYIFFAENGLADPLKGQTRFCPDSLTETLFHSLSNVTFRTLARTFVRKSLGGPIRSNIDLGKVRARNCFCWLRFRVVSCVVVVLQHSVTRFLRFPVTEWNYYFCCLRWTVDSLHWSLLNCICCHLMLCSASSLHFLLIGVIIITD